MVKYTSSLIIGFIVALGLNITQAQAFKAPADYMAGAMYKVIKTASKHGPKAMCKKGKFPTRYSLRSFEGNLCRSKLIAAFAVSACIDKVDDFVGSKCHTKAMKSIGTDDPEEATVILKKEVKSAVGNARTLVCLGSTLLAPQVVGALKVTGTC